MNINKIDYPFGAMSVPPRRAEHVHTRRAAMLQQMVADTIPYPNETVCSVYQLYSVPRQPTLRRRMQAYQS